MMMRRLTDVYHHARGRELTDVYHCARGSRVIMTMRRLTDVYHHARGRELTSVSTALEARSMCDSTVYLAATV